MASSIYSLAPLVLIILLFQSFAAAQCYKPDGTQVVIRDYLPCDSAVVDSVPTCCALNRTYAPGDNPTGSSDLTRDACLPNGLCQNVWRDSNSKLQYHYFRVFCKNKDWSDCLNIEPEDTSYISNDNTVQLTPCDDVWQTTKWCYGANNSACCSKWEGHKDSVTIPLKLAAASGSVSSTASTSVPSVTATTSSLTSSTPGSATNLPSKNSLSAGAIVGIAVGAVIAGATLTGFVLLCILARRRKKMVTEYPLEPPAASAHSQAPMYQPPKTTVQEFPHSHGVAEMPANAPALYRSPGS